MLVDCAFCAWCARNGSGSETERWAEVLLKQGPRALCALLIAGAVRSVGCDRAGCGKLRMPVLTKVTALG